MSAAEKIIWRMARNKKSVTRQKTVLVVDDDTAMLLLTNSILKNDGYAVTAATGGAEALEALDNNLVDIAVLDIQMPNMSGLELYKQMQRDDRLQSIPVIFVTADHDKETVLQAVGLGAAGYIVKPYDNLALLQRIHAALAEAKIDQGALFLSKKVLAVVTALRHIKSPPVPAKETKEGGKEAKDGKDNPYDPEVLEKWNRIDELFYEIPQYIFISMFELMLKRLKTNLTARDIDSAINTGTLILEELQRQTT